MTFDLKFFLKQFAVLILAEYCYEFWQNHLLEALPEVFSLRPDQTESEFEVERDLLCGQIGKLQVVD